MSALDPLRAITLFPESASLVAAGLKTIETRPRRCNHRGPVAIHSGVRPPTMLDTLGDWCIAHKFLGRGELELQHYADGLAGAPEPLPIYQGAIVAVANLVDCVPIVAERGCNEIDAPTGGMITVSADGRHITRFKWCDTYYGRRLYCDKDWSVQDQLPYGIYSPGRHALLMEEVQPLPAPVPCRGNQPVPWVVPDDIAAAVREQIPSSLPEPEDTQ